MDQLRRDRASAQVLRIAFPALEHLRIELKFEAQASGAPAPQSHVLYPPARAFFEYQCPYSDCDGQFDLSAAVKTALMESTHRAHGTLECGGSRGREPSSRRPCLLQLSYEVTATYSPED
ncbi:MAG: hypothetical protein JO341_06610 [Gammaproteobacteria bacterium]|nr:hypothetical protein [Gammaproteobacteria bacterium]